MKPERGHRLVGVLKGKQWVLFFGFLFHRKLILLLLVLLPFLIKLTFLLSPYLFLFLPLKKLLKMNTLQFADDIFFELLAHFLLKVCDYLKASNILILLHDDVFIFLIQNPYSLLGFSLEEVTDGLQGIIHLDDLVFAVMNEIAVGCISDLQSILLNLCLQVFTEVLKDPADVGRVQLPFQEAHVNEIVDPRVSVLVIRGGDLVLLTIVELDEEQVFEDTDVFFMAIVS